MAILIAYSMVEREREREVDTKAEAVVSSIRYLQTTAGTAECEGIGTVASIESSRPHCTTASHAALSLCALQPVAQQLSMRPQIATPGAVQTSVIVYAHHLSLCSVWRLIGARVVFPSLGVG